MLLFLFIFIFLLQYIHSYNHSLITFAEALLHIFIAAGSVDWTSLGVPSRDSNSGQLVKHSLSFSHSPLFIPIPFTPSIILFPKLLLSACRMLDGYPSGDLSRTDCPERGEEGEWGGLVWHLPELYCSGVYHIVIITPLWGEHKTERTLLHIESSRNS